MFGQINPYRFSLLAPWATAIGCAMLAISDAVLSAITPGYNIVGETSSQLMSFDARYSSLARLFLALYAVLLIPFAAGLSGRFPSLLRGKRVFAVLAATAMWVHIVAALISALAQNDLGADIVGGLSANEIHDQAAIIMFSAALAVLIAFAIGYGSNRQMPRLVTFATLFVLAGLGPLFVAEIWTQANGVVERVLGAAFLTWLIVIAWSWRSNPVHSSHTDVRQP